MPEPATLAPPQFPTAGDAYLGVLGHISRTYEYRNAPRKNAARECLGLSFQIANPRERLPYLAARRTNPAFCFAEALWYLGGRNDLAMMAYYAPQIAAYSRDGQTLVGSAYGSRMFRTPVGESMSPFDRVIRLLRKETDSKRGVLPIFGAEELAVKGNPDVSCVVALHLLAREGCLNMVCYMRANDCYRGLLSDVFSFTMIQEFAAVRLGLRMGTYTHHIGSAHICDRDFDRAQTVLEEATEKPPVRHEPLPPMPADTTFETLVTVLEHEERLRTNQVQYRPDDVAGLGLGAYWQQVLLVFEVQRQIRHCTADPVDAEVLQALHPGLRWLVAHRWPKRMPAGVAL